MSDDATLADVAAALLAAAVAAVADPPARQFVSTGRPAEDCPLVAAWFDRLRPSSGRTTTDLGNQRCRVAIVADLGLVVIRRATAWEGEDAPSVATLTSESIQVATDAYDLWRTLVPAVQDGSLWPGIMRGASVTFGEMQPVGPQGERAGVLWRLSLQLAPAAVVAGP